MWGLRGLLTAAAPARLVSIRHGFGTPAATQPKDFAWGGFDTASPTQPARAGELNSPDAQVGLSFLFPGFQVSRQNAFPV